MITELGNTTRIALRVVTAALASWFFAASVWATQPAVTQVLPPGGQRGTDVELIFDRKRLDDAKKANEELQKKKQQYHGQLRSEYERMKMTLGDGSVDSASAIDTLQKSYDAVLGILSERIRSTGSTSFRISRDDGTRHSFWLSPYTSFAGCHSPGLGSSPIRKRKRPTATVRFRPGSKSPWA
jgi:hypothetical protein